MGGVLKFSIKILPAAKISMARRLYVGVFLISLSSLVLEISLTRLFSIAQWHHFAFMVISIALFGFAASGALLSVFPRLLKGDVDKTMSTLSAIFSISIVASFLITNPMPFDPYQLMWDSTQLLRLAVYYVLWSLPFLFAGSVIALAITRMSERVNTIYFSSLAGSGLGAGVALLLMSVLPESGTIFATAAMGAASLPAFARTARVRIASGVWAVLLVLVLLSPPAISISPYKSLNQLLNYEGARIVETAWNVQSRVDVVDSPGVRMAPGLSLGYRGEIPPQLGITMDGDSLSALPSGDGFTDYLPLSLPYKLSMGRTLIINPGGGLEVLVALENGASPEVLESNPLVAEAVRRHSDLYDGVPVVIGGPRDLPGEEYDLIVLPLSGSVGSSSLGVYGMSENYIFTVEGFRKYLSHLSDDGFLAVTRWLQNPPRELLRIVAIASSAMEDPKEHIAVIRTYVTSTVLVRKEKLTDEDIKTIKEFCKERNYDLVYYPGIEQSEVNIHNKFPEPLYHKAVSAVLAGNWDYLFDVSPTTDDKPFFSNFFRWDKIGELYESMGKKWEPFFEGGFVIFFVLAQALILSAVFILLPVLSLRKIKDKVRGKWFMIAYFFSIGLGFMMFEMASIQRLTLWLGHPVYSFSLVLSSILFFSGLGSIMSKRMKAGRIKVVLVSIAVLIPFYPMLFAMNPGGDIMLRAVAAFLLLVPIGLLLGVPFPVGVRMADSINKSLIPWSWAANGCASVLGSIIGALVAISIGITAVFLLASLAYLIALVMSLRLAAHPSPSRS